MFPTQPRSRSYRLPKHQVQVQVEEKPEPGSDSTYGVRSMESVQSDMDFEYEEGQHEDDEDEGEKPGSDADGGDQRKGEEVEAHVEAKEDDAREWSDELRDAIVGKQGDQPGSSPGFSQSMGAKSEARQPVHDRDIASSPTRFHDHAGGQGQGQTASKPTDIQRLSSSPSGPIDPESPASTLPSISPSNTITRDNAAEYPVRSSLGTASSSSFLVSSPSDTDSDTGSLSNPLPLSTSHLAYLTQSQSIQPAASRTYLQHLDIRHTATPTSTHGIESDQASPPSSPALSLESFPSYVASASSLSRMSSPGFSSSNGEVDGDGEGEGDEVEVNSEGEGESHLRGGYHRMRRGLQGSTRYSPRMTTGFGRTGGLGSGSEELVLPMLNINPTQPGIVTGHGDRDLSGKSLPLIAGLSRWSGKACRAIKVAIVGDTDQTARFLDELKEQVELVMITRNAPGGEVKEIGVVRDGKIIVLLSTSRSGEAVHHRVVRAYSTLHDMLHPSPSSEAQRQIAGLVESHSTQERSQWVHLVLALHIDITHEMTNLVPTASTRHIEGAELYPPSENDGIALDTRVALPPPTHDSADEDDEHIPDPTPRCDDGGDGSSYFAARYVASSPARSPSRVPVEQFLRAIADVPAIQRASTKKFFAWRSGITNPPDESMMPGQQNKENLKLRRVSLESPTDLSHSQISQTSSEGVTTVSSLDDQLQIMPTVARAQGGGEWEANLSRRLAKRRQSSSDDHPDHVGPVADVPGGSSGRIRGMKSRGKGNAAAHDSGIISEGKGKGSQRERERGQVKRRSFSSERREKDRLRRSKEQGDKPCGPLFPLPASKVSVSGSLFRLSTFASGGLGDMVEKTFGGGLEGLRRNQWRWAIVGAVSVTAAVMIAVGWQWAQRSAA